MQQIITYMPGIHNVMKELYKQMAQYDLAAMKPEDELAFRRQRGKTLDAVNLVRTQLDDLVKTFDLKGLKDQEAS